VNKKNNIFTANINVGMSSVFDLYCECESYANYTLMSVTQVRSNISLTRKIV